MIRLFGLETEYSFGAETQPSERIPAGTLFDQLVRSLKEEYGWDSDPVDHFLPNGGRLYLDLSNAEWATPECRSLRDLIEYDRAGERMFTHFHDLGQASKKVFIFKNNVSERWSGDYVTMRKAVGCHENYLVPARTRSFPNAGQFFAFLCRTLVPFLVTRQILCGAGKIGFDGRTPLRRSGYQISQRSDFMDCLSSQGTLSGRGIINLRNEPHADPERFRRLHLILGDANRSPWSILLKIGTTALVLNMIADNFLDFDLEVIDPVTTIHAVSHDLNCRQPLQLNDRLNLRMVELNAIEIQRKYLEQAKLYLAGENSPEDDLVVRIWEETLDLLDTGNVLRTPLYKRIDWVRKLSLINTFRARQELEWTSPMLHEFELSYHKLWLENERAGQFLHDFDPIPWPEDRGLTADPLRDPPSDTRALLRGLVIMSGQASSVAWNSFSIKGNGNRYMLEDPLDFNRPDIFRVIESNKISAYLQRALHSCDPEARVMAMQAIATLGDRSATSALVKLASDPNLKIRMAAKTALVTLSAS